MPQLENRRNHPNSSDLLAESGIDDDNFGDRETTAPERDDDPVSEEDYPAPFGSGLKSD